LTPQLASFLWHQSQAQALQHASVRAEIQHPLPWGAHAPFSIPLVPKLREKAIYRCTRLHEENIAGSETVYFSLTVLLILRIFRHEILIVIIAPIHN
jgi:hypothetical protein